MNIRLRIADSGEDALAHWLRVDLLSATGEILDWDIFRYVKQTKRVITNSDELEAQGVPDDAIELFAEWEEQEANHFDLATLADTASRHFLRRQGTLVKGQQWAPKSHTSDRPEPTDDKLSDRRPRMHGALLEVGAPDIRGTLRKVDKPRGTVTTISAQHDGHRFPPTGCSTSATEISIGDSDDIRAYAQFSLSSLPTDPDVSNVDLKVKVTTNHASAEVDIQAYNQNGRASPNDDCSIPDPALAYTRMGNDASPYIEAGTQYQTTGVKTIDLGASADTDVEGAKASVIRFSLGWKQDDESDTWLVKHEALENAGTDEPKLVITHTHPQTLTVAAGIASAEAFGEATISVGSVTLSPSGIASAEAFGVTVVGAPVALTIKTYIDGDLVQTDELGESDQGSFVLTLPTSAIGRYIQLWLETQSAVVTATPWVELPIEADFFAVPSTSDTIRLGIVCGGDQARVGGGVDARSRRKMEEDIETILADKGEWEMEWWDGRTNWKVIPIGISGAHVSEDAEVPSGESIIWLELHRL